MLDTALAAAVAQAQKSTETFRHGAALLAGPEAPATGRNRNADPRGPPSAPPPRSSDPRPSAAPPASRSLAPLTWAPT